MIGSSAGMLEIATKIKAYGHYLIVVGINSDDPCHKIADKSVFADYSNSLKCGELVKGLEIEFVVPGSNDVAFETSHYIAKLRGLPHYDTCNAIKMLHNKKGFRKLLDEVGLKQPRIYDPEYIRNTPETLQQTTLLIKPELSFSGRGISMIRDIEHLTPAIELAMKSSRNGGCVIEEYIEGSLFSVSAFLENKAVKNTFFVNEFCFTNPYAVCASFTPSTLKNDLQNYVKVSVSKIAKHLNLKNGLIHIQFIMNNYDEIYFIECMRRMIGDFYAKNIIHAYGIDYYDLYLRPFLGMTYGKQICTNDPPKNIARKILCGEEPFIFGGVKNPNNFEILEYIPFKVIGDHTEKYPMDKGGVVFYRFDGKTEKLKRPFHF